MFTLKFIALLFYPFEFASIILHLVIVAQPGCGLLKHYSNKLISLLVFFAPLRSLPANQVLDNHCIEDVSFFLHITKCLLEPYPLNPCLNQVIYQVVYLGSLLVVPFVLQQALDGLLGIQPKVTNL